MHVLLLDDSRVVRKQLERLLSSVKGVTRISKAEDAETALDLADRQKPDLLILDLELGDPNRDGLRVLNALSEQNKPPRSVVFSNHPELREHALAAGAEQFFDKSRDVGALLSFVSEKV